MRFMRGQSRIEHPPTRRAWKEEKVSCPECSKVLIAGVDKRPTHLKCGSCGTHFDLLPKTVKVEIACPNCGRKLRMKKRPGERNMLSMRHRFRREVLISSSN